MAGRKTMSRIMAEEMQTYCQMIKIHRRNNVYNLHQLPLPDFSKTLLPGKYAEMKNLVIIKGITEEYFTGLNNTLATAYENKEKIQRRKVYSDGLPRNDNKGNPIMETFFIPKGSVRIDTDVKLTIPNAVNGALYTPTGGFLRGDVEKDEQTGKPMYTYVIPYENATLVGEDSLNALVLTRTTTGRKAYSYGEELLLTDGTTIYMFVTSARRAVRNNNRIVGLKKSADFDAEIKMLKAFLMHPQVGIMFPAHMLELEEPFKGKTNLAYNVLGANEEE